MNKVKFIPALLFILLISFTGTMAQSGKESASKNLSTQELLKAGKDQTIWMLTYFRQRYPTRVEIDAQGKVIEIPLPDPMQVEQLHISLSIDGRHWTPINDNNPVWDQRMRDPYIGKGTDGIWRLLGTGGGCEFSV